MLCFVQTYASEHMTHAAIRIGTLSVLARPGLHDFLKCCYDNFDVVIWSALDNDLVNEILSNIMTDVEMRRLKYVLGQEECLQLGYVKNSNKTVVLKSFKTIAEKIQKYRPENIIQIHSIPSHGSQNAISASLFTPKFRGSLEDSFFRNHLIPHLQKLSNSGHCLVFANKVEYPSWSITSLQRDWVENDDIWKNLYLQRDGDKVLINFFKRSHINLKSKYRKL